MNRYENIVIIDADVGEDEKKGLTDRVEGLISKHDGELVAFDEWGMRKLAYEIKKKRQGQYLRIDFCGTGALVEAIERLLRHDQRILRFMTIQMAENADPEALKAAYSKEQTAAPEAAPAGEATAEPQPAAAPAPEETPEASEEAPKAAETIQTASNEQE